MKRIMFMLLSVLLVQGVWAKKPKYGHKALPFWPLGLAHYSDQWLSLGIQNGSTVIVAVWRKNSTSSYCNLPVGCAKGKTARVTCIYPQRLPATCSWNKHAGILSVQLPACMTARLFELDIV